MDNLLKIDLTAFNHLPPSVLNIRQDTKLPYFEIEDNNRNLVICSAAGCGTARYNNPKCFDTVIIDYDGFLTSLPHDFQQGKKRCDSIVYTQNCAYFLLNELKDRIPKPSVLAVAITQLLATLREIKKVPNINTFIGSFTIKRCLYCNKQVSSPSPTITATIAFNRIGTLAQNGFKLSNSDIASLGFELFEYMGNHIIQLN
ncbi:MAG: hypothetical protein WCP32_08110 [Bacteroidota bacterium]